MNEEQRKWREQFASNIGAKELLRVGCAIGSWILILVVLAIIFGRAGFSSNFTSLILSIIMVVTIGVFPYIAHSWRLDYSLLRKILGNENLPREPYPRLGIKVPRVPLPRWAHLLAIWHWLMLLLILYIILKWYFK